MSIYTYAGQTYADLTQLENAVTDMKATLDGRPTTWCVVKPAINKTTFTIDDETIIGYEYGGALDDTQILALNNSETIYNMYAVHDGDNFTNISESEVVTKVKNIKKSFAGWLEVDIYYDEAKPMPVTNEDMSGYV